jgi:gamma-glutamyl-gamma-aminobutyraldehyde dehydrogenase
MLQYAGQSNMKRVALECGGKSPQVFMGDLSDMGRAVTAAYTGIYANMGEVCNAGSRLLVERSIYDEFSERFVDAGREAFKPGDPLDPKTNMGPLVTKGRRRVLLHRHRQEGRREAALGGAVPAGSSAAPTCSRPCSPIVNNGMQIAREEIFGPVASMIPFDGVEEAIAIANDTIYGLAAGVWTRDLDRAMQLIKGIEAGVIWVNSFDEGDMTQPFGGYKQSGNARDKCFESLLEYTQMKSAWIRLPG